MPPLTLAGYPNIPRPTASDVSLLYAWIIACLPGAGGYVTGGVDYAPSDDGGSNSVGAPGISIRGRFISRKRGRFEAPFDFIGMKRPRFEIPVDLHERKRPGLEIKRPRLEMPFDLHEGKRPRLEMPFDLHEGK